MPKVIVGKEISLLASRNAFGAGGDLMVPWLNKELRIDLESRSERAELTVKSGALDKERESAVSFSGKQIGKTIANHAHTLFRVGSIIEKTEKQLLAEAGIMAKLEGYKLPQATVVWLAENREEALKFAARIEAKSADALAFVKRAKAALAEEFGTEEKLKAETEAVVA